MSDQDRISPYNINTISSRQVMKKNYQVNYHIWGVQLQESAKKRKILFTLSKVSTSTCKRVQSTYSNV